MTTSERLLEAREKGETLPLSIGTAQAIESLAGLGDFSTPNAPIAQYDECWVNLRTLFRNCFNALGREARVLLSPESLVIGVQEDWLMLQSSIRQASHSQTKAVLYYCSFDSFERTFPNARYKTLSTERQREEQQKEDATIAAFLEQEGDDEVKLFDVKITGSYPKVVMMTHYPVDLLWHRAFRKLELVESHTGTIKPRSDWHTKLTGGRKLAHLPFNTLTIQVFGDGNVLFASMLPSIKKEITELAVSERWHSVTTPDKVRHGLSKLYDPRVKEFFRSLL